MPKRKCFSGLVQIEVLNECSPSLERRLCEGLLEFGRTRPNWRFSMREAGFRYTRDWLREQRVSGVLVLVKAGRSAKVFSAEGIPWVHLLPEKPVAQASVSADDLAIGRSGAEFFLRKGYLRTAFCGAATAWSRVRASGFRQRMAEGGGSCVETEIPFNSTAHWELGASGVRRLRAWP